MPSKAATLLTQMLNSVRFNVGRLYLHVVKVTTLMGNVFDLVKEGLKTFIHLFVD